MLKYLTHKNEKSRKSSIVKGKKRMCFVGFMLVLCLASVAPSALAQQTLWKQIPLGDWFIAGNWSAGVPNSGNSAIFGNPAADGALITAPGAQAQNVFIGVITTNAGGAVVGRKGSLTLAAPGGGGTPGDLAIGDRLVIGQSTAAAVGEGTLNISAGGTLSSNQLEVAVTAFAPVGTINISDSTSYLVTGRFTLGNDTGRATLNLQNGSGLYCTEATIAGNPSLAGGSANTGTATVAGLDPSGGGGAHWEVTTSNGLVVGYVGNGSLAISDYGRVIAEKISIATLSGSTGAITVTTNGVLYGYRAGIPGNIIVSGWEGSTTSGGAGSLRVFNGGRVLTAMLKVFSTGVAEVNNGSTSAVGLELLGAPPPHTMGGSLGDVLVGSTGAGRMEIKNGGATRGQRGYLGFAGGSDGAALITGTSSLWSCDGSVWVGNGGNGTLEVREGGNVTSLGNGYIAFSNNTTGYALVSGINSAWTMSANLYIGGNASASGGNGTLQIENFGTVSAAATTLYNTGTLALGASPQMDGTLTSLGGSIRALNAATFSKSFTLGAGGVHVQTNFNDLTFTGLLSGTGGLDKSGGFTVGPGTLTLVGNNSYTGGTTVSAGRLLVSNNFGSATGTGPVTVTSSSGNTVLGGAGAISGPVTVNTNSIVLGGRGVAATGALTIANNLTLNPGAKVQLVLGASGAHSTLSRTGGTWSFPNNLAFRFIAAGAQTGFYDNIITGLTSDPGNVGTWTIETPGFTGSFSYDGAGNIDLNLTDAPPSTSCAWNSAAPYPIPILDHGVVVVGANLYSFGGTSDNVAVANAYEFDGTAWTPIAPLPEARAAAVVVSDGAFVYVVAGYNSSGVLRNTLYRYDPGSDTYTTLAPAGVATYASAGAFLNGKLYKIAGALTSSGTPGNAVEVYNIATNSWSSAATYPQSVSFLSGFARNGFIYGAGGTVSGEGNTKTYRYDPGSNTWFDGGIADLPAGRWGAATLLDSSGPVLAGGFVGGDSGDAISAAATRWDPAANTWSALIDLLEPRGRTSGGVLAGRLSVIGGRSPINFFEGTTDHQVQACPPFTFTVTTVDDHNDNVCNAADCTLREAITAANTRFGLDAIAFTPGVTGTIQLASALPGLDSDLILQGPGADLLTIRRNSGSYRIFSIGNGASVTLSGLTITNGFASGSFPANCGGGIYADHAALNLVNVALLGNGATLHGGALFNAQSVIAISNSTIATNFVSASGGAIFNLGAGGIAALSLTNCTLHQNSANQYGGAIYNDGTGGGNASLTILNCTLNENSATLIAGGIYNDALNPGSSGTALLHLGNTILNAGASGANLVNDGAMVISDGHNLSSDDAGGFLTGDGDSTDTDPQLDPAGLTNNGGATQTVALIPSSPAIDTGDDLLAPPTDQRSFARFAISDIGAFEFDGIGPTPAPISISGTISYCSNPVPGPVPNVTLTLSGGASGSTLSDSSGSYEFSSLAVGGNYIVTPTKSALAPGSTGITGVDAVATQRHFLNLGTPLSGCRLAAAEVTGNSVVDGVDAVAIQRFFLGFTSGIGNVGEYQFSPASRTYSGVVTDQTDQNYDTLVFGDVASTFVERLDGGLERGAASDGISASEVGPTVEVVALPEVVADQSKGNLIAAVKTLAIDPNNNLVGFQGDFTFDERVITFQSEPVQKAGLTGGNWNVSGNVLPGAGPIRTLRISGYSLDFTPISGSGTLFELKMASVSRAAQGPPLTWAVPPDHFIFIDRDLKTQRPGNAAPGGVSLSLPSAGTADPIPSTGNETKISR